MLRHTFIHGPGIGPLREATIWDRGAGTWEEYLTAHDEGRFPETHYAELPAVIASSQHALERGDLGFFAQRLPPDEHWRLYEEFGPSAAYVDIETTGLYAGFDRITVVAMHTDAGTELFVRGRNLRDFPAAVAAFPLVVTFNGAVFDLPFLAREFDGWGPVAHIDLRFALRRLGLRGGLKAIERQTGLARSSDVYGMTGWDAVRLWRSHERGDPHALDRLLEYARYDVVNLKPLAAQAARDLPVTLAFRRQRQSAPTSI
jgi:uncharacterized protein YprB with RNaseH-like and TPR domain